MKKQPRQRSRLADPPQKSLASVILVLEWARQLLDQLQPPNHLDLYS